MVTWTNVEASRRAICNLDKKMINAEDVRSDLSHSRLIKIGTKAFEPLKVTRNSALKVNGERVDDLSLS
jgi:hypothetical protein